MFLLLPLLQVETKISFSFSSYLIDVETLSHYTTDFGKMISLIKKYRPEAE